MKKSTKVIMFTPKEIIVGAAEKAQARAQIVRETAQNIWFAGLGALSLAEDQGG